jgi:hypothetical protein
MTLYCTKCGKKHEFTLEKPKFCSECGNPFGAEVKASATPVKKIVPSKAYAEVEDSEEDAEKEVPQISEILVEIETDNTPKFKFGEAKKIGSFAREKPSKPLTIDDLNAKTEELFKRDRQDSKENK